MNAKERRMKIKERFSDRDAVRDLLESMGIDVTRSYQFKLREEKTPSSLINKDGSCFDFGTGERFSDVVSLYFDGYKAFNSLGDTLTWLETKI